MVPPVELVALAFRDAMSSACGAVAENNLRADIRTIERAWKEKPSEGISAKSASN